jgi:hypothetical protein
MNGKRICAILAVGALIVMFRVVHLEARNNDAKSSAVIPQLSPSPTFSDVTAPANGDVNPYGVAFVPEGFPQGSPLHAGDIVVSNFNNSGNFQGTGTTIVRVNNDNPNSPTLFFEGPQNTNTLGLTTALGVLKAGFVLVGNLPSTDGSGMCTGQFQNVGQGGLLVIDKNGNQIDELTSASLLNGPWDLTVKDEGQRTLVFVANALSGTVTRIDLRVKGGLGKKETLVVESETQIASGYLHRCDMAAFVVAPTGLVLDEKTDTLYVASTGDNAIFAVSSASTRTSDAGMGTVAIQDATHLHGPLGLVLTPNGDFISTQGDAVNPDPNQVSEVVEFTHEGEFVAEFEADTSAGGAFGIAIRQFESGFIFATVDDNAMPPVLNIWVVK